MKFNLILLAYILHLYRSIECKIHRVHLYDVILPYNNKSVPAYSNYFSHDHFILEEIDDGNVQIGGYIESVKSMVRKLPIKLHVRTQYYYNARWNDAAYQLTIPNACPEFVNPKHLWYNITKLWGSDVCPSQKGDQWQVEANQINILIDMPRSIPIVPWRAYVLVSQGLPGFEIVKYGFGFQMEFLPLK